MMLGADGAPSRGIPWTVAAPAAVGDPPICFAKFGADESWVAGNGRADVVELAVAPRVVALALQTQPAVRHRIAQLRRRRERHSCGEKRMRDGLVAEVDCSTHRPVANTVVESGIVPGMLAEGPGRHV